MMATLRKGQRRETTMPGVPTDRNVRFLLDDQVRPVASKHALWHANHPGTNISIGYGLIQHVKK